VRWLRIGRPNAGSTLDSVCVSRRGLIRRRHRRRRRLAVVHWFNTGRAALSFRSRDLVRCVSVVD